MSMHNWRLFVGFTLLAGLTACGSNPPQSALNPSPPGTVAKAVPPAALPARKAQAKPPAPTPAYFATRLTGDYAGYASTRGLIDRLEREQEFDREYLQGIFSRVERQQWILDFLDRPKRTGKPSPGSWTRYSRKFITDARIGKGVSFWREHAADLDRAEARFGVPAEYVVAILGVETNYGSYLGSHKVINALATLAFDYPRRAEFFSGELEAFLVMARSEGFDPFEPVGSYAGAMGLGQFMPSSFHGYAVDFDGDGLRDLWNPVDAIGSVANYFSGHGWRSGEPVAVTASARSQRARAMEAGYTSRYSPATLAREGVLSSIPLDDGREVSLLRLDTVSGPEYWIGLHNFYVITRYNHSTYYAMAVHQLAEALRQRTGQPAGPVLSDARRDAVPVN